MKRVNKITSYESYDVILLKFNNQWSNKNEDDSEYLNKVFFFLQF